MFATLIAYQSIINNVSNSNPIPISSKDLDSDVVPIWAADLTTIMDCVEIILSSDVENLEAMII